MKNPDAIDRPARSLEQILDDLRTCYRAEPDELRRRGLARQIERIQAELRIQHRRAK